MSAMFDILQIIFWSITYILVIIAGIQSRSVRKVSMPFVAGILNFSWEVCALIVSHGFWGHILWMALDCGIVCIGFRYLNSKKGRLSYAAALLIGTVIVYLIFYIFAEGMLYSVFIIDVIMALWFLKEQKKLSPKLQTSIAFTKLIGDAFAGIHYAHNSIFIAACTIVVFICNIVYLCLCIRDRFKQIQKRTAYK